MARPRNDVKRSEIIAAAIRAFAEHGLGASTASIATAAAVSNGALFTYFPTKIELLNQAYVAIKLHMAAMSAVGLPGDADERQQMLHVWHGMLRWAREFPQERLALARLAVAQDITPASRDLASAPYAVVAALLDRCRAKGAMRDASPAFVARLVMAMMDATIDEIAADPAAAERHAAIGFEAVWSAINGSKGNTSP